MLVITKQPGANVIETVDAIKAALPRLQAAIPPTVNVNILVDRTQTIRASVRDVEHTLLLTIALVVMVIFVFLRSVAGDADPERHRAAGADRHRGGDVPGRLQPRQPVADGADDLGRASSSTTRS